MSTLATSNRRQANRRAAPARPAQPDSSPQTTFGNEALLAGVGRGKHGEMVARTAVSDDNRYAYGATAEARDGLMTGGTLRTSDNGRKNTLDLAAGAYQGDSGDGLQARIGGSASQSGGSVHGSARMVAADQGGRLDLDAGGRVESGPVSVGVTGRLGSGLVARIEHDEQGAFLVVQADAAVAGSVDVGGTAKGADGGKAATLTGSVGVGLGAAGAIRRRLDGMQAAQAQHAIEQGDDANVFRVLGMDGPAAVASAVTTDLSPHLMQPGESQSTTTSTSANLGIKATAGMTLGATGTHSNTRTVDVERTQDGVRVSIRISAAQSARGEVGVGYAGLGATGFADTSTGSDQSLVVTLDPQHPAFDLQYAELVNADTGAQLAGLAALHTGSVLTGVDAVAWGAGMTASVGAVTGTARIGTTATDQTVQEGDDTVRTQSVSGGVSGRVQFGDMALSAQDQDTLATVERNGEVQAMTIDIGGSTVSFTKDEVDVFIARVSSPSNTRQAAQNADVSSRQLIAFPTLIADLQHDLQQTEGTQAKLDVIRDHAKSAPNALLPMLDRVATGVILMPSDDLGSRTEWPESLDYQARLYTSLMDTMPDLEDTATDLITLANRTRELDDVENALDAAEFTSGRARLDMLEQCFLWRQQLAAKRRGVEVDVSEVERLEVTTGVAAEFLDRMTAKGRQVGFGVDRAVEIWVAERRGLRRAYEAAGVVEDEWKTSPWNAWETRELDADKYQYTAAITAGGSVPETSRWI